MRIPGAVGQSFRFLSDSVPVSVGHRSDFCRTVFRADAGQFSGIIGRVSDRIGRVSEMARNGVRQGPESRTRRSGATLDELSGWPLDSGESGKAPNGTNK